MYEKVIISNLSLVFAINTLMFANTQNPPKKVYISKLTTGDIKNVRTPSSEEILCYYYEDAEVIHSTSLVDFGNIQVTVINTSTGESWLDMFNSADETIHILHIPCVPGIYELIYTTDTGAVYTGTLQIEYSKL